ncbi:AraC family transcriptional regulator [Vibrio crassostreae]|uniref:AraC family transcriptional regulator n=1 Tax=Vibrio crassostreae TaxID=246167 RepID=UPI001B31181B|nr:AraC family transcriptional regulator [Vibrio crassostreae]CAK2649586.1 AraC family transcriptional regulator [Vibrio crassostreae]CAK3186910.1 AraC family transcriptional regulator [Vibrio crassostreae]
MKRANKFLVPPNWKVLFNDLGIDLQQALRYAELPLMLFSQSKVILSPPQYFQLWRGIEASAQAKEIDIALKLAEVMSIESFDVPIFAAICSPNLNAAVKRLQEYKPLIGPMELNIQQTEQYTQIDISCYGYEGTLPRTLNLVELVFFTQLARLATRKCVQPIEIILPELPSNLSPYQTYFGCSIHQGKQTSIAFSAEDARTPFLTDNQLMVSVFESALRQRLETITHIGTTSDAVYKVLLDLLPQGDSSIESVASFMALSKRTLQRKLATEGVSYQTVLQKVRQQLAEYYLNETELPLIEVSFLLGFQEPNSFIRAYSAWTGVSPGQVRI